jgi:hypothetical protein
MRATPRPRRTLPFESGIPLDLGFDLNSFSSMMSSTQS